MPTTSTPIRQRQADTQDAVHAVSEGAHALREQIGESAREVSATAQTEASKVSHIVRDWLAHQGDAVRQQAHAATERTERYVRDEPLKSVLLAAAAGALVTGLVVMASRKAR